jgi:anaerobic selenocysteine-containing dehydrogenase
VTRIDGDRRNPITDGFICGKVRKIAEHLYGSHRVLTPLRRIGAKGSRASSRRSGWDDALDEIAGRLAAIKASHGGEAILPYHYGGSNGWLTEGGARDPVLPPAGRVALRAHAVRGAVDRGGARAVRHRARRRARGLPARAADRGVGRQPVGERHPPGAGDRAGDGRRRALIVVDPRATPLARRADLHLAVRPGTDLPVALALIRELFARGHADRGFLAEATPAGVEADRGGRAVDPRAGRAAESGVRGRRPRRASSRCTPRPRRR